MIMMMGAVTATAALVMSLPATTAHAVQERAAVPQVVPMGVAVSVLPVAAEDRNGYQRTSFRHWNAGENPGDGCNTRQEVLIQGAIEAPEVGPGCTLIGGVWWSYYDDQRVTPAGALDIDHMIPLAEAWGSQQVIPLYHPVWARTDPTDIAFADRHAAHGNFRNWARLTAHTLTALEPTGRSHPDQEVLRWAFSRLGSWRG